MSPQPIFAWPLVGSQIADIRDDRFCTGCSPARNRRRRSMESEHGIAMARARADRAGHVTAKTFIDRAGNGGVDLERRCAAPTEVMRETFAGRVWTWRLATALLLASGDMDSRAGSFRDDADIRNLGRSDRDAKHHQPRGRQGRVRDHRSLRASGRGGLVDRRVGLAADWRDLGTRGRKLAAVGDVASLDHRRMVSRRD